MGGVLLIAGLLFLFLEICLRNITIPDSGITGIFYNQFIIYAIAYSIPFLVGYSVRYLVKERVRLMTLIVLLVLIISAVVYYLSNGLPFEITPLYKYPPHAYYIIYGCCISALLYCLRFLRPVQNAVEKMKMPVFIGQNTIWIYFWHIPWLLVVGIFVHQWVISFVLVYILSVTTYILQYRIVAKVNKQFFNKYFVG